MSEEHDYTISDIKRFLDVLWAHAKQKGYEAVEPRVSLARYQHGDRWVVSAYVNNKFICGHGADLDTARAAAFLEIDAIGESDAVASRRLADILGIAMPDPPSISSQPPLG